MNKSLKAKNLPLFSIIDLDQLRRENHLEGTEVTDFFTARDGKVYLLMEQPSETQGNRTDYDELLAMLENRGFSLPTADEWAYLCGGGCRTVPFPVSWTVKMKKKQKETQDILSYHTQAAGCSDKARAKASGGRQPIEECGRTGL